MSRTARLATGVVVVAGFVTSIAPAATAAPAPAAGHGNAHVCATAAVGYASCLSIVRTVSTNAAQPQVTAAPDGYGPADIQSAYNLGDTSSNKTVAIVDAFNDPTAEHDLGVYRSQYGLPACTKANHCFRQVSQTGSATNLPRDNAGWALEISLDLDMVSATCPSCKILLVEADSASFANLGIAVNYAATQAGVVAISNSYGGADTAARSAYNHPGIAVTASSGDSGYGVSAPASFKSVVGVGGTSLVHQASGGRDWTETAWNGAGSGCSTKNVKPRWQTAATQCGKKAVSDVSAVADPNTGVAVYDSTPYQGQSGWFVVGGTSASSPIIASVYALSGNTAGYPASYTWAHTSALNDVTVGTNGACTTPVWCVAGTGWDGPTGLGTPNGTGAF